MDGELIAAGVFSWLVSVVTAILVSKLNDRAWERIAVARGAGKYDMDGNFSWIEYEVPSEDPINSSGY